MIETKRIVKMKRLFGTELDQRVGITIYRESCERRVVRGVLLATDMGKDGLF